MKHELLCIRNLDKQFEDSPLNLRHINMIVNKGDIIVITGKNGAGKSTLLRLIGGYLQPDSGTIMVDGHIVHFKTSTQAKAVGIYYINLDVPMIDNITVADYIFIDTIRDKNHFFYSPSHQIDFANHWISKLGLSICASALISELSFFERMQVCLVCAAANHTRLLLIDEPLANLNESEIQGFKCILKQFQREGIAIVMAAPVLNSIYDINCQIYVLSDGMIIDSRSSFSDAYAFNQWAITILSEKTLSYSSEKFYPRNTTEPILKVIDLCTKSLDKPLSFSVYPGEAIGLFYADSSPGCTEILDALFGLIPCQGKFMKKQGQIFLNTSRKAVKERIGYIAENNIFTNFTVQDNITLAALTRIVQGPLLNKNLEKHLTKDWQEIIAMQRYSSFLSRGIKKQIELIRWLCLHQDLLLLHEPFSGLDTTNQKLFLSKLETAADRGTAFIIQSASTDMLANMCHRVFVFKNHQKIAELQDDQLSSNQLLSYSF